MVRNGPPSPDLRTDKLFSWKDDDIHRKYPASTRQERKEFEERLYAVWEVSPEGFNLFIKLTDPKITKVEFDRLIREFNIKQGDRPSSGSALSIEAGNLLPYGATFIEHIPATRELIVWIYTDPEGKRSVFLGGVDKAPPSN